MTEQTLRRRAVSAGPSGGGLGDLFSTDDGLATVSHGLHTEQLPVGNMTVAEIRRRYSDRFDVDPRSQAQIDGRDVDENTVVRAGQLLMFVRVAGEKGAWS